MAVTKALLDSGADVSIMVHNGLTSRDIAQRGKGGIMKILEGREVPICLSPYDERVIGMNCIN